MAKHWVQVKRSQLVARYEDGVRKMYYEGDWLQVTNREVAELSAQGKIATLPALLKATFDFRRVAVVAWGGCAAFTVKDYALTARVTALPELPAPYTVLTTTPLTHSQTLALGLLRIEARAGWDAWEIAAQLQPGYRLAAGHGSDAEQAATAAVIGDLRAPLYDTSLLWVRKTAATQAMISAWVTELQAGADRDHAFLRALYGQRVLLATLPPHWIGTWKPA